MSSSQSSESQYDSTSHKQKDHNYGHLKASVTVETPANHSPATGFHLRPVVVIVVALHVLYPKAQNAKTD